MCRPMQYMQEARDLTYAASPLSPPLIDDTYANVGGLVQCVSSCEVWWTPTLASTGSRAGLKSKSQEGQRRACDVSAHAHCTSAPGNGPAATTIAVIRNALTRSDGVIKTPSNDPFTGPAIVRTMVDIDPNHPLTKHISIAHWRGGDEVFEEKIYQPHNFEKIVAWGGFASMKHVTRYIQPGLELISLDPKRSASVIGAKAFDDEAEMQEAATRLASDFGGYNQLGCVNSRVAYVQTGTDDEGLEKATRFAQAAYDALATLPGHYSTVPKDYPSDLRKKIDAVRLQDDFYTVIGGRDGEGAVVLSLLPEAVDFMPEMEGRSINIVPIDDVEEFLGAVDAYTQTIGVYPEELKEEVMDILPLYGCQRMVSLGYAVPVTLAGPQGCDRADGPHGEVGRRRSLAGRDAASALARPARRLDVSNLTITKENANEY